jgi:hypothetical protein
MIPIKQNVAFRMLARPSSLSLRRAQLTQPQEKASRCETGEPEASVARQPGLPLIRTMDAQTAGSEKKMVRAAGTGVGDG